MLASSVGSVAGMAVFDSGFGHSGMALADADVLPRATALLAGENPAALGDRVWRAAPQSPSVRFSLDNFRSERAFAIEAPADGEVTFRARSRSDVAAALADANGHSRAKANENEFGTESITVSLDGVPPFFPWSSNGRKHTAHVTVKVTGR